MTTTNADNGTPGTLKASLIVWMLAMAALLGYSIATAEATPEDSHEAVEEEGEGDAHAPEPSHGETGTPKASPAASGGPTASPVADVWETCAPLAGVEVGYPSDRLAPGATACDKLASKDGTLAVLFQFEDKPFADKLAELRAEKNPDVVEELKMRNASGHPAGVVTYHRDASTYVTCEGASIEYVYYVEAPKDRTLIAVSFACEKDAEEMHAIHDGILGRLKLA